jgi:hypothetical protein
MGNLETLGLESRIPFSDESTQIQLDDSILDVKLIDEKSRRIRETKINIKALILSCVQAALSTVKDRNDNSERETDRVTLILKLLEHGEGTKTVILAKNIKSIHVNSATFSRRLKRFAAIFSKVFLKIRGIFTN